MNRRRFLSRVAGIPPAIAAVGLGVAAISPEPSLADLMVRAFHRLGRQNGKRVFYAHPELIRRMREHFHQLHVYGTAVIPTRPL